MFAVKKIDPKPMTLAGLETTLDDLALQIDLIDAENGSASPVNKAERDLRMRFKQTRARLCRERARVKREYDRRVKEAHDNSAMIEHALFKKIVKEEIGEQAYNSLIAIFLLEKEKNNE